MQSTEQICTVPSFLILWSPLFTFGGAFAAELFCCLEHQSVHNQYSTIFAFFHRRQKVTCIPFQADQQMINLIPERTRNHGSQLSSCGYASIIPMQVPLSFSLTPLQHMQSKINMLPIMVCNNNNNKKCKETTIRLC